MFGEQPAGGTVSERLATLERFPVEKEYGRCLSSLVRVGAVSLLPRKESLGVIGLDGEEYAIPTSQEITHLLDRNKDLVGEKMRQGFTRLQLVPFATPLVVLKDRAKVAILKHAKEGKIFQAKRNPSDSDVAVAVNTEEPLWMWDTYLQDGSLIYFPKSFSQNPQGITKPALIQRPDICAVPGWSVTLVEDSPFLAQPGQGSKVGERAQLETNHSPHEYLQTLQHPEYQGETGFTPEDLLIDFLTRLEETNQVSHDWDDNSAAWLTGTYFPQEGYVPVGLWNRVDRRLRLGRDYPGHRAAHWGAPSTVRLKP